MTVLVATGTALPSLDRLVLDAGSARRPPVLGGVTSVIVDVLSPPVDATALLAGALVVARGTGSRCRPPSHWPHWSASCRR